MKQDHKIITLLTDFGLKDIYVAVMKGVIYQINPKINIIDLTHDIPPQNIAAGRFNLLNAYPYFPEKTVHIAVVDPEVGTKRRAIAIQFNNNYLVGPDNGLLTGILEPFLTCEMEAINRNNNMEAINCNNNMEAIWATVAALAVRSAAQLLARSAAPKEPPTSIAPCKSLS